MLRVGALRTKNKTKKKKKKYKILKKRSKNFKSRVVRENDDYFLRTQFGMQTVVCDDDSNDNQTYFNFRFRGKVFFCNFFFLS